ncbi:DUF898 family protein [Halomonas sabkhae]|uniref:DUF898 family protein n=1 Tax=Halomonas sabkhae TaxID=626223 RepID=UPI0025B53E2C|nr:DUF898 family protein [Halomonas sabkhae]MDN3523985.1 DUF898 family protein [Halomonas sabkhae]
MEAQDATLEASDLEVKHHLDTNRLFSLMFKTGLLTVITLGIYRFWQTTRVRQYLWSSTSANEDALEYTGTGLEKFLGFLVAVVVLAVYLGIMQMVLFYFGLSAFGYTPTSGPAALAGYAGVFYLNVFAVIPLMAYAFYQRRRYMMSRTRWRGIRLGMDKGAWGYVARAIGYGLLNLLSLGLLMPLFTFKLEQYMAERSYYGDTRLEQRGRWTHLYPAMKHMMIAALIFLLGGLLGLVGQTQLSLMTWLLGGFWMTIGWLYYRVRSFAYLTSHKVLGGEVEFQSEARTGEILRLYVQTYLGIGLLLVVLAFVLDAVFLGVESALNSPGILAVGTVLGYILLFVLVNSLTMVMLTQPKFAHLMNTFSIRHPERLHHIQQRQAAGETDNEGFAEALDVGGAI